ncbi:MAG: hypothetical protein LBU39_10430 [Desulfobulbaceae bacterium]|nr:hypothetical protein [Desulfobulbaceae bacterium]
MANSLDVRLGQEESTIGFPRPGLQGFAPKDSKGEIAANAASRTTRASGRSGRRAAALILVYCSADRPATKARPATRKDFPVVVCVVRPSASATSACHKRPTVFRRRLIMFSHP